MLSDFIFDFRLQYTAPFGGKKGSKSGMEAVAGQGWAGQSGEILSF